jgi:hypothetical protein
MKNIISCIILLFILSVISSAQTSNDNKASIQSFNVGGVSIKIPLPDTAFVEVGYDNRKLLEVIVPQNNKLIGAFVLKSDFPNLFKGNNNLMTEYSLIEVPRAAENMDCETSDFNEVIDGVKESFGNFSSVVQESEEVFNSRMKSLDLADMQIKLGQPTQLGCFFSKKDRVGFGMLMGYDMGGKTIKMGATIILMRVNKRLLFVYIYSEYKNDETITWLRNIGESWSAEILKANNSLQ